LPLCCGWAEDRGWDLSEPLARLGEFVGRCVIGFVPVQALCGVGVDFLFGGIVSVRRELGRNVFKGQCMTKGYNVRKANMNGIVRRRRGGVRRLVCPRLRARSMAHC